MRIVLEILDFGWEEEEVEEVKRMYLEGKPIREIARRRAKHPKGMSDAMDETALLLMDLCRNDELKPRKGGVHGK